MKPYLIPKNFDLSVLKEKDGRILFSSDRLALAVQSPNPHIPENTGFGVLSEATVCKVVHGPKGYDELELEYPDNGRLFKYITYRCLIVANVERTRGNQAYRIYKIKKTINGRIRVNARHIAYDLAGIIVAPFKANNLNETLTYLKARSLNMCPFSFTSTRNLNIPFEIKRPTAIWELMGSEEGNLQDVYNGEYLFDNYSIAFEDKLGSDRGVNVTYGVNMTDFEQESSCENCYTGAIGYWENKEESQYSRTVKAPGNFSYEKILTVDLSSYWDEKPTKDEITEATKTYVEANKIGIPEVSWTINFVPLDTTEEYKNIAQIQNVSLGDTVHVRFERLGVDASARVVEIEWDVLADRYSSISLGDVKKNLASTIVKQSNAISKSASREEVFSSSANLSNKIDSKSKEFSEELENYNYLGNISADQIKGGQLVIGGEDDGNGIIKILDSLGQLGGEIKNRGFSFNLSTQDGYISAGGSGYFIMLRRSEEDGGDTALGAITAIEYTDSNDHALINSGITLFEYDRDTNVKRRTAYISGAGRVILYDSNGNVSVRINGLTGRIECNSLSVAGHEIT